MAFRQLRLRSALLLGALVILPPVAAAQGRDRAGAEALFRAGRDAAERGDYATACQRFEESNRLDPALGTLFNLADCEEKTGKLASAWQRFREVAQRLSPTDERSAIARDRAAALEPRLPKLVLHLAEGVPPEAVVVRDGVELGTASLGLGLPVDPGAHVVLVRAPGRVDKRYELTLQEAETRELHLEAGEVEAAATPGPEVPPTTPSSTTSSTLTVLPPNESAPSKTAGYVITGVGAASLVAGLVTGGLALSRKGEMDDNCDARGACNQTGLDAAEAGDTFATISTVTFGLGAVGVALGTVLLLTSEDETKRISVGATTGPHGGELLLQGQF